MNKNCKKYLSLLLMAVMLVSALLAAKPVTAYADTAYKGYLSLGADLNDEERAKVLELLGVSEDELEDYHVIYVTNAEEHEYLDSYISYNQIGDEAWSSVLITDAKKRQRHQCDDEECHLLYNRYVRECTGNSRCR